VIASVDDFHGQVLARQLLECCLKRDRTAGTFLLLGQRGLGKTTLATVLARAICCESNVAPRGLRFCGECYACRTIASSNQPEYVQVNPSGKEIRKEQFYGEHGVLRAAALHPIHLSHRIFIIDDAHYLNEETGNQLLKLLEEAPERTVFILTSDKPDMLLPTIHSRGRRVSLLPEPTESMLALLIKAPGGKAAHEKAAVLGAGRYVDTIALAENAPWTAALVKLAEAVAKGRGGPEAAKAAAVFEYDMLWAKQSASTGNDEEADKSVATSRKNELQRQALLTAYDRAVLWLLHRGQVPAGLLPALTKLRTRVNQNVDQNVAQAAFELALAHSG
jgi:DNA polymerase-3 subunit gamma/tau